MQFMPNSPKPPRGINFNFLLCITLNAITGATVTAAEFQDIVPLNLEINSAQTKKSVLVFLARSITGLYGWN
jgi:hypothetical protein